MSELGIKVVIVLAALAVAIGVKFLPSSKDADIVEKAAIEVAEKEIGCELIPTN